jgi:hypothetical protein
VQTAPTAKTTALFDVSAPVPGEKTAPAPLVRALERALGQEHAAGLRWYKPEAGFDPFYGDHFDPLRATIGGQQYRVVVSHEEGLYGPPNNVEEGRVAVLQRMSDGLVSSDLNFVVPLDERTPRPQGRVQYLPPQWW